MDKREALGLRRNERRARGKTGKRGIEKSRGGKRRERRQKGFLEKLREKKLKSGNERKWIINEKRKNLKKRGKI